MYKILYFSVFWDFKNPTESQKTQLWYAGPVSIIQTHSKQHPYPFKRRGTNTVWILASFRPTAFRYSVQERSLFTSWYGTLHFLFLINWNERRANKFKTETWLFDWLLNPLMVTMVLLFYRTKWHSLIKSDVMLIVNLHHLIVYLLNLCQNWSLCPAREQYSSDHEGVY